MSLDAAGWVSATAAMGALGVATASVLINFRERSDRRQLRERWQADHVASWIVMNDDTSRLQVVAANTSALPVWTVSVEVGFGADVLRTRDLELLGPQSDPHQVDFFGVPTWQQEVNRLHQPGGDGGPVPWTRISFTDSDGTRWARDPRGRLSPLQRLSKMTSVTWTTHDLAGRTLYGWNPHHPNEYWTWGDNRI